MRPALIILLTLAACAPGTPASAPIATPGPATAPYDLILEGGRVVDGTGSAWFWGDVALAGDRIARVAPRGVLSGAAATQRLDVRGMVVAPGFIDIQGQSDYQLTLGDGRLISKVTQGITTEIMGEGSSPAPTNGKTNPKGPWAPGLDFSGPHGFDTWLRAMQAHGGSENFGSFPGAGTVRVYAKGEAQGAATPAELDSMRTIVRNAMLDGAFGIGSALIYPPGNYASTEELIEIAKAMSPSGGIYITHMRSEGNT